MSRADLIRLAKLAFFSWIVYGLADFVFSWNPLAAAPYLLHRHEPVFRAVPALNFGSFAEFINGWIAALAWTLVEPALPETLVKRGLLFGLMVWGFWVLSGTFSAYVWLAVPGSLALANVVFGLPKCLTIGLALSWLRF